jgi:hypothetical protein
VLIRTGLGDGYIPLDVLLKAVGFLSACNPLTVEVKVADALDRSFRGISLPKAFAVLELAAAFLAMAFGSNFPAYGAGEATLELPGDNGEPVAGDPFAF